MPDIEGEVNYFMRKFDYITIGKILEELQRGENGHKPLPSLKRSGLVRLEKKSPIFDPNRRCVGTWGIYSEAESNALKEYVWFVKKV